MDLMCGKASVYSMDDSCCMNAIGEPCEGKPQARFDEGPAETRVVLGAAGLLYHEERGGGGGDSRQQKR